MCGIAVLANVSKPIDPRQLMRMRDAMSHRGPDDAGIWLSADHTVGLAHRRLAIIDLSPRGHQPMIDDELALAIVFNGEIYNYQCLKKRLESVGYSFQTGSDTEIIIKAYHYWGDKCVEHLDGMFAFVIYDQAKRNLFAARDRAGEKPLFYWHNAGTFMFASEMKAFFSWEDFPRQIDPEALNIYLAYGYVPGTLSLVRGVKKLKAGGWLKYNPGRNDVERGTYWKLPPSAPSSSYASSDELCEELHSLLRKAVRSRMIADVPVGILLSGGIDSSLVTAVAAETTTGQVMTFTVSFPDQPSFDEARFSRAVAEHFGTNHVELPLEQSSMSILPELVRQYDEPIADSSMIPTFMVCRLIRRHATVALGGDGGDELFGGYFQASRLQRLGLLRAWLPAFLRPALRGLANDVLPAGFPGRNYVAGLAEGSSESVASANLLFHAELRRKLVPQLNSAEFQWDAPEQFKMKTCDGRDTILQKCTRTDFATYLTDDILVKVDRASMLNSLEVRAPWLDPRIVEFAFGRVPDRLRATAWQRKILPKHLARQLLPSAVVDRKKMGFSIPLAYWLKGQWDALVRDTLLNRGDSILEKSVVEDLVRSLTRGPRNQHRIYCLLMLELWRQQYRTIL